MFLIVVALKMEKITNQERRCLQSRTVNHVNAQFMAKNADMMNMNVSAFMRDRNTTTKMWSTTPQMAQDGVLLQLVVPMERFKDLSMDVCPQHHLQQQRHHLPLLPQCHQLHQYVFMKCVSGQNGMMGVYKPLATMGEILKLLMIYEQKVMKSVKPQRLLNAEQKSSLIYH